MDKFTVLFIYFSSGIIHLTAKVVNDIMKELHENSIIKIKVESKKEHLNSSCSNDGNTGCSFLDHNKPNSFVTEQLALEFLSEMLAEAYFTIYNQKCKPQRIEKKQ